MKNITDMKDVRYFCPIRLLQTYKVWENQKCLVNNFVNELLKAIFKCRAHVFDKNISSLSSYKSLLIEMDGRLLLSRRIFRKCWIDFRESVLEVIYIYTCRGYITFPRCLKPPKRTSTMYLYNIANRFRLCWLLNCVQQ